MKLLDWLLGRGSNPLEAPDDRPSVAASPHVRVPEQGTIQDEVGIAPADDELVAQQARAIGVDVATYRQLVEERHAFVREVAEDPRAWGFDLAPASTERRDAAAEYRRRTRMTGALGDSFLVAFDPLLAVVPDPPTMPDGTPLDLHLERTARLEPDAARDIAQHVRTTIQATLGRPLDADAIEHAVREAAWDHDLDVARVLPQVLRAVAELI